MSNKRLKYKLEVKEESLTHKIFVELIKMDLHLCNKVIAILEKEYANDEVLDINEITNKVDPGDCYEDGEDMLYIPSERTIKHVVHKVLFNWKSARNRGGIGRPKIKPLELTKSFGWRRPTYLYHMGEFKLKIPYTNTLVALNINNGDIEGWVTTAVLKLKEDGWYLYLILSNRTIYDGLLTIESQQVTGE